MSTRDCATHTRAAVPILVSSPTQVQRLMYFSVLSLPDLHSALVMGEYAMPYFSPLTLLGYYTAVTSRTPIRSRVLGISLT